MSSSTIKFTIRVDASAQPQIRHAEIGRALFDGIRVASGHQEDVGFQADERTSGVFLLTGSRRMVELALAEVRALNEGKEATGFDVEGQRMKLMRLVDPKKPLAVEENMPTPLPYDETGKVLAA